jgi:prolyl-tRNA synthetase
LGTKYSTALKANFVDIKGKPQPIIMGCYGIGVSRLIPAIIECNYDAQGIIWPREVAPYHVEIIAIDITDEKIMGQAKLIHQELEEQGISVLLDDRDERAGVKFKDADLIGSAAQIVIGREFLEKNNLELKVRRGQEKSSGPKESIYRQIKEIING